MTKAIDKTAIAQAIWELATWMDDTGNKPRARDSLFHAAAWVLDKHYAAYRKDIFFYHLDGWRVRKKPHWKDVYMERFRQWYIPPENNP